MNATKYYGATYSTENWNHGELQHVFEVAPDWDGHRFHGYCKVSEEEAQEFFGTTPEKDAT